MESTFSHSLISRSNEDDTNARLNALVAREAEIKKEEKLYRRPSHQAEAALMRRPVAANAAWGHFGLLLGAIPPAAIFYKLFNYGFSSGRNAFLFVALLAVMNLVCALVGRSMARNLATGALNLERRSWSQMFLLVPLLGLAWGFVTGLAGGLLFFGIGAIGGIFFAVPVGIAAFLLFAVLHRIMERGTLIERKHLLPIAYGISTAIAAFILGF